MVKGQVCPVCGKYTFIEDDNFEICPVCGWEDDGLQREDPNYTSGANHISLNEAREAYRTMKEDLNGSDVGEIRMDI